MNGNSAPLGATCVDAQRGGEEQSWPQIPKPLINPHLAGMKSQNSHRHQPEQHQPYTHPAPSLFWDEPFRCSLFVFPLRQCLGHTKTSPLAALLPKALVPTPLRVQDRCQPPQRAPHHLAHPGTRLGAHQLLLSSPSCFPDHNCSLII